MREIHPRDIYGLPRNPKHSGTVAIKAHSPTFYNVTRPPSLSTGRSYLFWGERKGKTESRPRIKDTVSPVKHHHFPNHIRSLNNNRYKIHFIKMKTFSVLLLVSALAAAALAQERPDTFGQPSNYYNFPKNKAITFILYFSKHS